jgi:uncharacterized coiled-coil DUF342 family protein
MSEKSTQSQIRGLRIKLTDISNKVDSINNKLDFILEELKKIN